MPRKSFSIHSDFFNELESLTGEQRGNVLLALIKWAADQDIPDLDPICAMLVRLMTSQIERVSSANSVNGAKGGRPFKSETSEESEAKRKKPTVTVTDTVTDTVSNTKTEDTPPISPSEKKAPAKPKKSDPKTQYADFVSMTNDEYSSLVAKVGVDGAARCVEILDNYKGANGKRYVSDYRAILTWVLGRFREEQGQGGEKRNAGYSRNAGGSVAGTGKLPKYGTVIT